jgi:hypothetical protein
MDFNEWFYKVDDSGMNGFDRIIHCFSHENDDVDAIAALMEEAFNAGGNKDGTGDKPGKGKK